MKIFLSSAFGRFLVAGGIAALVNFLSRIFCNQFVSFSVAIIIANLTGMITAHVLNRSFVFEEGKHPKGKEIAYFSLVNLLAVLQTWVVSVVLYRYYAAGSLELYAKEVAHLVGVVVPVFASFIGHKYLTFRKVQHDYHNDWLVRLKLWVKNVFVFGPLVFSGLSRESESILLTCQAAALFCIASSAVYILNDLNDMDSDRRHPVKSKKRPLASGEVSPSAAI